MFGYKKLLKRLEVIETKLSRLTNLVNADEKLAKDNADLMDRLMARNWAEYVTYSGAPSVPMSQPVDKDPLTDVDNAGEILSNEEIGK